ncbi:DUF5817 domain-containing protein [Halocatena salina]|uniref:DUF5817 domain-containing protein n=1 Tax=Halocatena salina TaxID=2934340 RepID=A0A8T9ZYL7_9EURY|nr:DUF5817 domain-containing protein [Halocatena salina]UPM41781.1 DUF5817 domain-containing protein [Halocatena salina]
MYSVVGCPACSALKIVEDRPETTECPRCGRRTAFEKLRTIYRNDDLDAAREVRARLLAERSGHSDAYAAVDSFAELDAQADAAGMSPKEYLDRMGIDTDDTAAAEERATTGSTREGSRKEIVLGALSDLDRPTREEIVDRAVAAGVPNDYVHDALDKLVQRGTVTETDGRYRLL